MPNEDSGLLAVVRAISEGAPIDWGAAESSAASDSARALIRELRVVAEIATFHTGTSTGAVVAPAPAAEEPFTKWGHFRIDQRVGQGAYGEVYLAWDPLLAREVALKLLRRSDGLRALLPASAIEEGRLLARVRHPNVVVIHGAQRVAGRMGIWMEFVHGQTLEQLLRDGGPISAQEATAIGLDLCRALAAVHRAGLVHRDVKAQNVMREEGGRIVLMDFGIGKERPGDGMEPARDLAGTPLYLAPELLQGRGAAPRSDLYSLGVLLYHLVTGSYPVLGRTLQEVRQAHEGGTKTRLRESRPDLPEAFAEAVERALVPDPEGRYDSAEAMESALTAVAEALEPGVVEGPSAERRRAVLLRTAAGIAAAGLLAGGIGWWSFRGSPGVGVPSAVRNLVLIAAFENRTGDSSLDGTIEHALERELLSSRIVNVVARERVEDTLRLMRKPPDTIVHAALGREVCQRDGGITTLLAGRIERLGSAYVLSTQVVEPARGRVVGVVAEEAPDQEALAPAVRRLSNRVRESLGESRALIVESNEQLERVTTPSLPALRFYSHAVELGKRDQWSAALEMAKQAVAADPDFASAHIWVAWALRNTSRPLAEQRSFAERAVQLSETVEDWERPWILGSYWDLMGQQDKAAAAYEALVRLRPDDYWAASNLWLIYLAQGRSREAVPYVVRGAELRPRDVASNWEAAQVLLDVTGDFDRARPYADRARELSRLEADPEPWATASATLLPAYESWIKGDIKAALEAVNEVAGSLPGRTERTRDALGDQLTLFFLMLGRPAAAREMARSRSAKEDRHETEALVAFFAGDQASLRANIQQSFTVRPERRWFNWWIKVWLLARAGMLSDAEAFVADAEKPATRGPSLFPGEFKALRGDLALARARPREAAFLLEAGLAKFNRVGIFYRTAESLAEARIRLGEPEKAVAVLKQSSDEKPHLYQGGPTGLFWMTNRLKLAEIHHRLGQQSEAQAIEDDLARRLAYADPGFPMLERLERLSGEPRPSDPSAPVARRLWSGFALVPDRAFSTDGRNLLLVDWSTGDLAAVDLETGRQRRVTSNVSWFSPYEPNELVGSAAISQDGRQVAYGWFKDGASDLRLIDIDGTGGRVLLHDEEMANIVPVGWSSDARRILALVTLKDQTCRIDFVSAVNGSVRTLKRLGRRTPHRLSLSPDARYVAYDAPPTDDGWKNDIYLSSSDGTKEVDLIEHPADDTVIGWSPDGTRLVFASDRTGTTDAWAIEVRGGQVVGSPELVKQDIGQVWPLELTADGTLYYAMPQNSFDAFVATLDPGRAALEGAAQRVRPDAVGAAMSPDWSPDGRHLAYVIGRNPASWRLRGKGSEDGLAISVKSLETGETRELLPKVDSYVLRWSPDGRSLLACCTDREGRPGLYTIDVRTGAAQVVLHTVGVVPAHFAWTPDGRAVFYKTNLASPLLRRDLRTGREGVVFPRLGRFALSSDGRWLALMNYDLVKGWAYLKVMPVAGGEAREVLKLRMPEWISAFDWVPNRPELLVSTGRRDRMDQPHELWRVATDGRELHKLGLTPGSVTDLRVHPDGRRVAFSAQSHRVELWEMRGFLPPRAAKQR